MPLPRWIGDYIAVPFKTHGRDRHGCDCWGLVRLVLSEQFGIALPDHAEAYRTADSRSAGDIGAVIEAEATAHWRPIDKSQARMGDVIILRTKGHPLHVGLVVAQGQMLHVMQGANSVVEFFDGIKWKHKVEGFYRHASR